MKTNEYIREYYILSGMKGLKETLIKTGIKISPEYLLIVQEDSKLGKLIEKEARKKLNSLEKQQ